MFTWCRIVSSGKAAAQVVDHGLGVADISGHCQRDCHWSEVAAAVCQGGAGRGQLFGFRSVAYFSLHDREKSLRVRRRLLEAQAVADLHGSLHELFGLLQLASRRGHQGRLIEQQIFTGLPFRPFHLPLHAVGVAVQESQLIYQTVGEQVVCLGIQRPVA